MPVRSERGHEHSKSRAATSSGAIRKAVGAVAIRTLVIRPMSERM